MGDRPSQSFEPDGRRKRHCWECRRRYLVCDSASPACKRCSASGVNCPGYDDVKPTRLKWLAPGRVTSRSQRRLAIQSDDVAQICNETTTCAAMGVYYSIPRLEMDGEASAIVQGVKYYNSCMYQDLLPLHQLGTNPHVYPLTEKHLRMAIVRPNYLTYGMVCMTLSHRINRTRCDLQHTAFSEKFYRYWGIAIRSLNEHLGRNDGRSENIVFAGILTLLLTDIQQGNSLHWRCHLEGVQKLIALRGGFHAVAKSESIKPLLSCYWLLAVFSNTTCPTPDLASTKSQLDELGLLTDSDAYSLFAFQGCPAQLFIETAKINHVRMCSIQHTTANMDGLSQVAHEILASVQDFSPELWAESKVQSIEDWALMAQVYQAAVALYCILSLQSLSVLPVTVELRACCTAYGQSMQTLLGKGLASPRLNRFLVWPLVLLGVEAVHNDTGTRAFVAMQLAALSHDIGIYLPLLAKHVLETFWASGKTDWDDCFGRPYIFTSQIAVDTNSLL